MTSERPSGMRMGRSTAELTHAELEAAAQLRAEHSMRMSRITAVACEAAIVEDDSSTAPVASEIGRRDDAQSDDTLDARVAEHSMRMSRVPRGTLDPEVDTRCELPIDEKTDAQDVEDGEDAEGSP